MKNTVILLTLEAIFLFLDFNHITEAARRIDARERARAVMQRKRSTNKRAFEDADVSVNELLDLTEGETMEVIRSVKTSQGVTIERLQEKFKGIKVFDASVVVEIDKNGKFTGDVTGTLIQGIEDDLPSLEPKLSPEEAFDIALKAEGYTSNKNSVDSLAISLLIYLNETENARLTYFLQFFASALHIPKRPAFFIDAISGEILLHWNNIDHATCENNVNGFGGNTKIGKITYGVVPYCLDMTIKGNTCYLENKYVRVVDMKRTYDYTKNETVSFICNEGYNDSIHGAYSPAMDAFFYGTIMGKMFEDWFGTSALHEKVVLRVHYGKYYHNAFWNGETCTFGDGGFYMFPLVGLDIVCHEVGHGVTEQFSNLFYYGQSGGINEAFSDMLGEACENYFQDNDFLVGEGLITRGLTFLRSFKQPTIDNFSIQHVRNFYSGIDVHASSGIFNRAFYVVVQENGLELKTAIKAFYHANSIYWHHLSSFKDASCGVLKSAYDLGQKLKPYILGFKSVGIVTCNMTDHIRSLVNNKTYEDIVVSADSEPLFSFKAPVFAKSVYVDAACDNGDVVIELIIGTTHMTIDDIAELGGKRYTNLVNVQHTPGNVIFFILSSPNGECLGKVTVTAGYNCLDDFQTTDNHQRWKYENEC